MYPVSRRNLKIYEESWVEDISMLCCSHPFHSCWKSPVPLQRAALDWQRLDYLGGNDWPFSALNLENNDNEWQLTGFKPLHSSIREEVKFMMPKVGVTNLICSTPDSDRRPTFASSMFQLTWGRCICHPTQNAGGITEYVKSWGH